MQMRIGRRSVYPCDRMRLAETVPDNKKPAKLVSMRVLMFGQTLYYLILVPGAGIEPARCFQRGILSPVRLPIPPSRQRETHYY